ncbi:MAG: T9SS C-terminal target domain-containing protein [Bacteroidota bacterium]
MMRRFVTSVLFLLALTLASGSLRSSHAAPSAATSSEPVAVNTVTLPIEVLGASGYVASITVHVSNPAGADSLYIKGNHLGYHYTPDLADTLGYDQKASFRINGGAWVPISNATFQAFYPERLYYEAPLTGPIGGPWRTLRGHVALDGTGPLVSGANVIEFRFNRTEGISSGYRILELDLQRAGGHSVIDGTAFVADDPDTWTAPLPGAVAAGKSLWETRHILEESPLKSNTLIASCADCHATNGRDLKYFNFSNKSIVARSTFHGLTSEQGQQIASYIRSVNLDLPSGETVATCGGRPWDPPYQPGPGLDAQPADCWAAGAGMNWVLTDDEDTVPFIFPDEASRAQMDALTEVPAHPNDLVVQEDLHWSNMKRYVRPDSVLNIREAPLTIPLPDIFEWWPDIHPVDYFGEAYDNTQEVQNIEEAFAGIEADRDNLIQTTWERRKGRFVGGLVGITDDLGAGTKQVPDGLADPGDWTTNFPVRLSRATYIAIRAWELMHTHKLEDQVHELYSDRVVPNDPSTATGYIEVENPDGTPRTIKMWDRGWPETSQTIFRMATHMQAQGGDYPRISPYATGAQSHYFSSAWYQLALILDNGNRRGNSTSPFDWNYHDDHVTEVFGNYGSQKGSGSAGSQFSRYYLSRVASKQMLASFTNCGGDCPTGWGNNLYPGWRAQRAVNLPEVAEGVPTLQNQIDQLSAERRRLLFEAISRGWLEHSLKYDVDTWHTLSGLGRRGIHGPGVEFETNNKAGTCASREKDECLLSMLDDLQNYGTSATLVDSLAQWGKSVSPDGVWEPFMLPDGTSAQDVPLSAGWNWVSLSVTPEDLDMPTVLSEILDDVELVKNSRGGIYLPSLNINTIGSWNLGEGYLIYVNQARTLTVTGVPIDPASTPIPLSEGWNLVPYYGTTSMSLEEAWAGIKPHIVLAKDAQGRVYLPDLNIDLIGTLRPGYGYKVFMDEAVTLTYPVPPAPLRLSGPTTGVQALLRPGSPSTY